MLIEYSRIAFTFTRTAGVVAMSAALLGAGAGIMHAAQDDNKKPALTASADTLPSAQSLLEAAIESQGGQEAFDAIKSVHTKGKMQVPQMGTIDVETNFTSDGKFLIRQSNPMMGEVRMGCDGQIGWAHQGRTGYQLLEDEQIAEIRTMSMSHDLVQRLQEEFKDIKTVERTTFGGKECYKISMVHKESDQERFTFVDAETNRIAGTQIDQETDFGPMSVTITFSDWEERGDIMVFTKTTVNQSGMEMVMELNEIVFNEVEDSIFELPDEVAKLAAARQQREDESDDEEDGEDSDNATDDRDSTDEDY